jgi:4-amino-4-deoxy-L-arabinose transferase-like glycosyltransferase
LGFLSVGTGFHETDSIVLWGAKAQGLISEGLSGMASWGTNTTFYPLQIPILLGMFLDAFGLGLPAAKLIFPIYHFLLSLLSFNYLNSQMKSHLAGLSALGLATMPLIARHGMIAYANLPLTYYLVSGLILLRLSKNQTNRVRNLLLSGFCFTLAVWTRPEGIWLVLVVVGILLFQQLILEGWKRIVPASLVLLLPLTLELLWLLSRGGFYSGVENMGSNLRIVLRSLRMGVFHFQELGVLADFLLKNLADVHSWGAVTAVLLGSLLLAIIRRGKVGPESASFLVAGFLTIVLISLMYYVFSFSEKYDLSWWLNTGYERMIMPGMVLLWIGAALLFNSAATAGEG